MRDIKEEITAIKVWLTALVRKTSLLSNILNQCFNTISRASYFNKWVYIVFAGLLVLETVPSNPFSIRGMYNKKFNDVLFHHLKSRHVITMWQHLSRFIIRQYDG